MSWKLKKDTCSYDFSALSALALGLGKLNPLINGMQSLFDRVPDVVVIQWVSSHCQPSGNQIAILESGRAARLASGQSVPRLPSFRGPEEANFSPVFWIRPKKALQYRRGVAYYWPPLQHHERAYEGLQNQQILLHEKF